MPLALGVSKDYLRPMEVSGNAFKCTTLYMPWYSWPATIPTDLGCGYETPLFFAFYIPQTCMLTGPVTRPVGHGAQNLYTCGSTWINFLKYILSAMGKWWSYCHLGILQNGSLVNNPNLTHNFSMSFPKFRVSLVLHLLGFWRCCRACQGPRDPIAPAILIRPRGDRLHLEHNEWPSRRGQSNSECFCYVRGWCYPFPWKYLLLINISRIHGGTRKIAQL